MTKHNRKRIKQLRKELEEEMTFSYKNPNLRNYRAEVIKEELAKRGNLL